MSCDIDLRFVTNYNSWGSKRQKWVFHASEGEGRWQDQYRVLAPNIGRQPGLSAVEKIIQLIKFVGVAIEVLGTWFCNNWRSWVLIADPLFNKITYSYSYKVRRYRYVLIEMICPKSSCLLSSRKLHPAHFNNIRIQHCYVREICRFNGWSIL